MPRDRRCLLAAPQRLTVRTGADALAVFVLLVGAGCSAAVYQPARSQGFALDAATDVDDASIARALAGEQGPPPTWPTSFGLAFYAFDQQRSDALRPRLAALPGVNKIRQLPFSLREGANGLRSRDYAGVADPVSVRRMRLLAAREDCQVLVVADYGSRYSRVTNNWVISSLLLVPVLFAPMIDVSAESYLDVYAIDVQSGRLLAEIRKDAIDIRQETALADSSSSLLEAQWKRLLSQVIAELPQRFAPRAPAALDEPSLPSETSPPPEPAAPPKPESLPLPDNPEEGLTRGRGAPDRVDALSKVAARLPDEGPRTLTA
jgi:hypothetical protein